MTASSGFTLAADRRAAALYMDPKGKDFEGLSLVARAFAQDMEMVSGALPEIVTDSGRLNGNVLIAGSIGNNDLIDRLIGDGRFDVSAIRNKRETYRMQVVDQPAQGIAKALVIAGSDKRGTLYGLFHISERIGVTPWVYWADVEPVKRSELIFSEESLDITSKEPSVKYRGIFLNDEWPSLGSWVTKTFGGFNEAFYDKVFTLILRLKGNFMWPAMWSAVFSEDGSSSPLANVKLADAYGIVMGTSHHEPMFRAGEEWQKTNSRYGDSSEWSFKHNGEAITRFWEDGAIRNKGFESLITLGMRGERDSVLGGGLQENIDLLKNIITTQKELLKKHGMSDAPQVLTLYKEVESFWYGTDRIPGLKDWPVLEDVTIMLCEDNFGNTRTLPTQGERLRKAGWGMYYHVDYHGGPVSYEWVNTTPIEKIWEQMSMAYDYGIRDVWILNVGDLKPMEFPISYFLDLAYDFDTWGTDGINKTQAYTLNWVKRQFAQVKDEGVLQGMADILSGYTRMNGIRKPEVMAPSTFSNVYYDEAHRVLAKAEALITEAEEYAEMLPEACCDAYHQLIYYPAVASANIVKMQICAGLNKRYHDAGSVLANQYADAVKEAISADERMQAAYNDALSGGKWKGMMGSPHIGYVKWNADGWRYPEVRYVKPLSGASMLVDAAGLEEGFMSGAAKLPTFTNLLKERHKITISNGGDKPFTYRAEASADWIQLDTPAGTIETYKTIAVSVNWKALKTSASGFIAISGAGQTVTVTVTAEVMDTVNLPEMTFVGKDGVIAMEAEHTSQRVSKSGVEWKVIEHYGRTLSSLKMYPTTVTFEVADNAPNLEYSLYADQDGVFTLTAYTAPTNNLASHSKMRYGVSFDGGEPVIADTLPTGIIAGDPHNTPWCQGVLDNIHMAATTHQLTKGLHTLRIHGLDAGLVLQKLVLSRKPLPPSYLGPEESWYKQVL